MIFSICNILNTKQESGKIIKTVLQLIKNTGLIYHNNIYLKSLHSPAQDWRRYVPKKLVCNPPNKSTTEEEEEFWAGL